MGFFTVNELQEHMERYMLFCKLDDEKKRILQEFKDLKD